MFQEHNAPIGAAARSNPASHAKACRFVLATIRARWLPDVYETFKANDLSNRKVWFGKKLAGIAYIATNETDLWRDAMAAIDDAERIKVYLRIPGIGIAKAGFICQLVFGRVGCLDSHNLRRFGLKEDHFKLKTAAKSRERQIAEYIDTCARVGGAEYLWDSWCALIGEKYGYSAEHVSACHLIAV